MKNNFFCFAGINSKFVSDGNGNVSDKKNGQVQINTRSQAVARIADRTAKIVSVT